MTPTQGRIVIVEGAAVASNGATTAPAVITRTWGENTDGSHTVNLTTLPDCAPPLIVSSVRLYADREAALASDTRQSYADATVAYWPPRVG